MYVIGDKVFYFIDSLAVSNQGFETVFLNTRKMDIFALRFWHFPYLQILDMIQSKELVFSGGSAYCPAGVVSWVSVGVFLPAVRVGTGTDSFDLPGRTALKRISGISLTFTTWSRAKVGEKGETLGILAAALVWFAARSIAAARHALTDRIEPAVFGQIRNVWPFHPGWSTGTFSPQL